MDGDGRLLLNARGNMQNKIQQTTDGIGLRDIAGFFQAESKTDYVVLTPNSYEAQWELQMAQLMNCNVDRTSTGVSNSEVPATLVQRLHAPTVYPAEVREHCGVHEDGDYKDYLDGVLKINVVKNVPNLVEMKVLASSPDRARKCAEAVTAMIVARQSRLIEERMAGRKVQLAVYSQALTDEQKQLDKIKNRTWKLWILGQTR